ncbi:MAG: hypothetical protein ACYTG5_20055, partial [Planctomycetota bacterium]
DTIVRRGAGLIARLLEGFRKIPENLLKISQVILRLPEFLGAFVVSVLETTVQSSIEVIKKKFAKFLLEINRKLISVQRAAGGALSQEQVNRLKDFRVAVAGIATEINNSANAGGTFGDKLAKNFNKNTEGIKKDIAAVQETAKKRLGFLFDTEPSQLERDLKLVAEDALPAVGRALEKNAAEEQAWLQRTRELAVALRDSNEAAKEQAEIRSRVPTAPVQEAVTGADKVDFGQQQATLVQPELAPGFRESLFGAFEGAGQQGAQGLLNIAQGGKDFRLNQLEQIKQQNALEIEAEQSKRNILSEIKARADAEDFQQLQAAQAKVKNARIAAENAENKVRANNRKFTINATKSLFNGLLRLSGDGNEKIFKATKAYAIADATISAFRAANQALSSGIPPPGNIIAAAAALANGLANVRAIKSQTPGGGGGTGGGGGSLGGGGGGNFVPQAPPVPAAPVIPEVTTEEGEALRGRRDLAVIIEGNVFGDEEFVRDRIAPVIRESLEDNEDFGLQVQVSRS